MLHFPEPHAFSIDLRHPVGSVAVRALTLTGLERSFGIITAENPLGVTQAPERNAMLAGELHRDVLASGSRFVRIEACGPDRSHCERSIAVVTSCEDAVRIASEYDQLAIFWFDGRAFWIVPARSTLERVRLPRGSVG